jgi:endonuclease/exonuclease/phosphatase family metal-dependent hydrolase
MWTLLRRIKPKCPEPWLMLGDFNEAMWQDEHFSKTRRSERQMMDFREVLSFCDVHDLGFTGVPWTFDNKQKGDRNVQSQAGSGRGFASKVA